jgi:hypothetical protein
MAILGRFSLRGLGSVTCIAFLIILPWCIRNEMALGTFALRSNLGLEAATYNNDLAGPTLTTSQAAWEAYHPNANPDEAAHVRRVGESEYNRRKMTQAVGWITQNPAAFLKLTARRIAHYWLMMEQPFIAGLTVLSLFATWRARREGLVLLMAMLATSVPYCLINSDVRYRLPILWATVLFASHSLALLWGQLNASVQITPSATREKLVSKVSESA